jgi:hypothetical protein
MEKHPARLTASAATDVPSGEITSLACERWLSPASPSSTRSNLPGPHTLHHAVMLWSKLQGVLSRFVNMVKDPTVVLR